MRNLSHWFFSLLSVGLLLFPMNVYAQTGPPAGLGGGAGTGRGFNRRQWKPGGQMRGETYHIRSKLRELRQQEARRPRDIQAAPSQGLTSPGGARPDPFGMLNSERAPLNANAAIGGVGVGIGTGGSRAFALPFSQTLGPGTNADDINMMDPLIDWTKKEESTNDWWEMNERSRTRRGGGFRTRFGSRQPAQMQQRQQQGGGQGTVGPPGGMPGVSGGGGSTPTPGQNRPAGGGGGFTPPGGQNISPGSGMR